MFTDLALLGGFTEGSVVAVGETSLSDLKTRPDYAITAHSALVGFVELKAPGKGADPRRFSDLHDKDQWGKLKSLPNLIYTDGNAFSLWRNGQLEGKIVRLEGDIETSGAALAAPSALLSMFVDFLQWQPTVPRNAKQLANVSARLCRLLRDEVTEQLARGTESLTALADDWRKLLFPSATDAEFADGYAQAVTFGLLMARARGIKLSDGLEQVAKELRKTNSLIGGALRLLTDEADNRATLKTSLGTLTRVLDAVHWPQVSKGDPEAWLYFYEEFLSEYDNDLRKKTGSYYTPPEIVTAMVRLVDEALCDPRRFGLSNGFASPEVTVADPAVGTGTFLLGVLRRIAATTVNDQGEGAVPAVIEAALQRLIGFELQFGPFAVAQLRLLAEIADLTGSADGTVKAVPLRLYVADTLANPKEAMDWIPAMLQPLAEQRRQANLIKLQEPITVVIGNPPYKEKAKGLGGWVESGSAHIDPPLKAWMPPSSWGVSAHAKHLRNLYVYFWRWATWKVFGEGAGAPGAPSTDRKGVVCFITVAGFLNGPGFQKMRADLRRDADEIWVIDCSPEGHQPKVSTRVFEGVQQPVCIVMALRRTSEGTEEPAHVRYRALPAGHRKDKFIAISTLTFDSGGWLDCPSEPRAPFLPEARGAWASFPMLDDLFIYNGSGVMPGRTWVIAPDAASLQDRWTRLREEADTSVKENMFHPHLGGDRGIHKVLGDGLHGHEYRGGAVANDTGQCVPPIRYGFRSFDRQWIIPDKRLINRPNPTLWAAHSNDQVYLTGFNRHSPTSGPAVTFTALIPDLHHYKGSFGGRAYPLLADVECRQFNVSPLLTTCLAERFGRSCSGADVLAYIACLAAHPGYVERFRDDLKQPGLRVPITDDGTFFDEAVRLGREIIWLHTFGERYASPQEGRPAHAPRLPDGEGPRIPKEGAIPSAPDAMPDTITYDSANRRLNIGSGFIENVPPEVWNYEVSGKSVLIQWFSYRRRNRARPIIGDRRPPSPLGGIQPDWWLADYTTELFNVLHVLGRLVRLEPAQASLLTRICEGPLISVDTLRSEGAFDLPPEATGQGSGAVRDERQADLL